MIGHAVEITRVSARGIKNSAVTIKKIANKHNYLVKLTVIWIDRDKVLIEEFVDGCLEKKPVLSWVDPWGPDGVVFVSDPVFVTTVDPEGFVPERKNMRSFETRPVVISDTGFRIRKPWNHAFPVAIADFNTEPFLSSLRKRPGSDRPGLGRLAFGEACRLRGCLAVPAGFR